MAAVTTSNLTPTASSEWEIDPSHSSVQFSVRHMMVTNVRGKLAGVTGTIRLDERDLARSAVEARIDAASIDTRDAQRDAHLKSPEFLDVEKFPALAFVSRSVKPLGDGRFAVAGDLTLHGVTREVVLEVESEGGELKDPFGKVRRGAAATARIRRKDFDLTWNVALETGGVLVSDEVKIEIDVSLVKKI